MDLQLLKSNPTAGKSDGRRIVNALSFDIEDYFHAAALEQAFGGAAWEELPSRVEANTRQLLDLLDDTGAKATFFVLGWVAERHPGLVRDIHARSHEVASHGFSHRLIYRQSRDEFRQETLRSKGLLEDAIGAPVHGYRAASFSITGESLWALRIIREAGFEYDSSIFPIHHDRYGVPGASRFVHRIDCGEAGDLIEFPPSTVRIGRFTLPVGGGGYFRLLPYWYTQFGMRRLNRNEGQPLMFYLHPWEVDVNQPVGRVGWLTRVRHYRNIGRCAARLRRLVSSGSFAPIRDILQSLPATSPSIRYGEA
jgi:polysaccharide deacetylase family protein (PEP-CTERM system associated)